MLCLLVPTWSLISSSANDFPALYGFFFLFVCFTNLPRGVVPLHFVQWFIPKGMHTWHPQRMSEIIREKRWASGEDEQLQRRGSAPRHDEIFKNYNYFWLRNNWVQCRCVSPDIAWQRLQPIITAWRYMVSNKTTTKNISNGPITATYRFSKSTWALYFQRYTRVDCLTGLKTIDLNNFPLPTKILSEMLISAYSLR